MIFESHAHYDDERFDSDRVELLSLMKKKNVGRIINVGTAEDTSRISVSLAHEYDFIYAAVGVHPDELSCLSGAPDEWQWLWDMVKHEKKVVSVGEIGLDYYRDKDDDVRRLQRRRFLEQLDIAREADLPVIIHSRDAAEETFSIMKDAAAKGVRGVIHCYSYSPEMAEEYVKLGFYIGVGGVVTFKNGKKLKETVRRIPLERILTETDSPYLAPEPFRGMRNDSTYIPYVIQQIAGIREITEAEVTEVTWQNGCDLFGIG